MKFQALLGGAATALVLSAFAAPSVAQSVQNYNFDSLSGLDSGDHTPLNGQDGWVTTKYATGVDIGVTQSLGLNGSQSLNFTQSGPGVGADASRLNDGSWSIPTLDGSETDAWFQADVRVNTWGVEFGPVNDVDGSGHTTRQDASEVGPRLRVHFANGGVMRLYASDGTFTDTTLAAACNTTNGDWVRLRLIMDLTANGGSGSGDVYCMNLTNGEASWSAVAGLQGIDLQLSSGSGTARDATTWHGMFLHFAGADGHVDDFVMRKRESRCGYDFDSLGGLDSSTHMPLNGQDGWVTTKYSTGVDIGVTQSLGFNGSQSMSFTQGGAGVGADASRLNDGSWSIPTLDGSEGDASFQADVRVNSWGVMFGPVNDVDGSGHTTRTDASELGPRLQISFAGGGGLRLYASDGTFTETTLAAACNSAHGDWVRLRLIMDLTANGGSGAGDVYCMNLTNGETSWTAVAGLQGIDLQLLNGSGTARDATTWHGVFLHFEGPNGHVDDFVMSKSLERYDFDCLAGDDAGLHMPLNGQDGWVTTKYSTGADIGVTQSLGFNGSQSLSFTQGGAGVGADASRLNDSSWSIPTLDGSESDAWFQADVRVNSWGVMFGPVNDVDGSGHTTRLDASELGPRLQISFAGGGGLRLYASDGTFTETTLAAACNSAHGDWVRLRLIMDLTANGGSGAGDVYCMNLTNGETSWTAVAGLQGIDLQLLNGSGTARDAATWNGAFLHFEGPNGHVDDFVMGSDSGFEPMSPGMPYCFGDGSGISCPCTIGNAGEGCANSGGAGGATLTGDGSASMANDTFELAVTGVPGSKPGLVLRGNNQIAAPAGDGILCTAGGSMRSHVQVTSAGTTTFTSFGGAPFGSVANVGAPTQFQFWYRDPANTCSGAGFNFTNGWSVTYLP